MLTNADYGIVPTYTCDDVEQTRWNRPNPAVYADGWECGKEDAVQLKGERYVAMLLAGYIGGTSTC